MKKCIEQHWIAFTGVIILIYCLLLSIQGFDLTDEGYVLVGYQNFFDDHLYASHLNGFYLTGLVGGIWEKLFGFGGWYSFRVLNCLIILGGYVAVCYTLRDYWHKKWWIFAGFVFVLVYMISTHGTLVFHYYTFSAFMNCLISLLLYKSYKDSNNILLLISSFLMGVNIFVRLPNIMLCVIPFALSVIAVIYDRKYIALYKQIEIICVGLLFGIILSLFILFILGHEEMYFGSLNNYSKAAQNAQNSHGILPMIKTYSIQALYVLLLMAVFISFFWGINHFFRDTNPTKNKNKNAYYLLVVCCTIILIKLIRVIFVISYVRIALFLALAYVFSLFIIYKRRNQKNTVILISMFIMVSIFQPIGSDLGIDNMGPYAIWGLLPVSLAIFMDTISMEKKKLFSTKLLTLSIGTIIFSLTLPLIRDNLYYCYRDEGARFEKTYIISSLPKANIYTSKQRAEEIDSIIHICRQYGHKSDSVFFALDVPGLYYLTRVKPYLSNPWPNLFSIGKMDAKMKEEKNKHHPPLIVRRLVKEKREKKDNLLFENRNEYNNKVLDKFISENHYKPLWHNNNYIIYVNK